MLRRVVIILVLVFIGEAGLAQSERAAQTSMAKKRWSKAHTQLKKALANDSLNAAAHYVYAIFFFSPENPAFHIDSAYRYTGIAANAFTQASPKDRERLKRFPLDSLVLVSLREKIDSAAFHRAQSADTEDAYLFFLSHFPLARQQSQAGHLRDEAAYRAALALNTHESFGTFLKKYPGAARAPEARTYYDRLLFESTTADRKLASYERLLREVPGTPYRVNAERQIFEISTATGDVNAFFAYLARYTKSPVSTAARNIAFHLMLEQGDPEWPGHFLTDSLQNILGLQQHFLIPILHNQSFGFMDAAGNVVINPAYPDIDEAYRCGNVQEDVLALPDALVARNGAVVYSSHADEVDDLGWGFIKVTVNDNQALVHKSGVVVADSIHDARVIAGKFLAVNKGEHWALLTLAGRRLTPYEWDNITALQQVVLFERGGQYALATPPAIARVADGHRLTLTPAFDEVKLWPPDKLWTRTGTKQGVRNLQLGELIPMSEQLLSQTSFGLVAALPNHYVMYDQHGQTLGTFTDVVSRSAGVAVKSDTAWHIFDPVLKQSNLAFDTIRFAGPFMLGERRDSVIAFLRGGKQLRFAAPTDIAFLPGKDSLTFPIISAGAVKTVYDHKGRKLFSGEYDQVQYAGEGFFIVHKRDKKGLVTAAGKLVLPLEYDALGSMSGQIVSVLRNMKFGAYHTGLKKLIKPQYEKNPVVYNATTLAVFQKGKYGFVDWNNKPITTFDFDEIQFWNDTTALVRRKPVWQLYHIAGKKVLHDNLRKLKFIKNSPAEKLTIVQQENTFGVISNTRGTVIPVTFSDIVNVGSADEPVYFTEKHVEEASIFVVIYYNHEGKMIRRQVFEEDEYEKIYCSHN